MRKYWRVVAVRAFFQSCEWIGQSRIPLVYAVVVVAVGLAWTWYRRGWPVMAADVGKLVLDVLVFAVLAWVPFFVWALLRTPYEFHRAEMTETDKARLQVEALESQIAAAHDFEVSTTFVKHWIVKPESEGEPWWLLFSGVVLMNRTDKPMPLELSLYVGLDPPGNIFSGDFCQSKSMVPGRVSDYAKSEDCETWFGRIVNLPGHHADVGNCAADFGDDLPTRVGARDTPGVWNTRPIYLMARNTLGGEPKWIPMNMPAIKLDTKKKQAITEILASLPSSASRRGSEDASSRGTPDTDGKKSE